MYDTDASTFSRQGSLPKLPIPSLKQTCDRFLEWTRPILKQSEWEQTCRIVKIFQEFQGPALQQALIEWSGKQINWLEIFWDEAYLSVRDSLVVNVNPFYWLEEGSKSADMQLSQVDRATNLIHAAAEFKSLLDKEQLTVDMDRDRPLCMHQYQRMFATTRVPQENMDILRSPISTDAPTSGSARHIAVFCRGKIYRCYVFNETHTLRSAGDIKADLCKIIEMAHNRVSSGNIGILTTLPRYDWARARKKLVKNSENARALDSIETALFTLSLDDAQPKDRDDMAMQLLTGDAANRWFDKSLQFIVFKDGKFGINMEHTGMDATPVIRLGQFIANAGADNTPKTSLGHVEQIEFSLDNAIKEEIAAAELAYSKLKKSTYIRTAVFNAFGKDRIKAFNVSPDAYVQLAMQLAQYRVFGTGRSIYEAVMTRGFMHGRTEAMRPVSMDSLRFVKCMDSRDQKAKSKAFIQAAKTHSERLMECKSGNGAVRHIFGLQKIHNMMSKAVSSSDEIPLYNDTGWKRLQHDSLSTSSAGSTEGFTLGGFGPVVDDGLGIKYAVGPNKLVFTLSSRSALTNELNLFTDQLFIAFSEIAELLSQD